MSQSRPKSDATDSSDGLGFLLSQVGSHSAARFAEQLEPLGIKPMHVGVLGVIQQADGISQQALAERLGVFPSRLVALIDDLERLGLVERRSSPTDRRSHALYLTGLAAGARERIDRVSREHRKFIFAALDEAEQEQMADFLRRIAAQQGLAPGVHPGFRKMGGNGTK